MTTVTVTTHYVNDSATVEWLRECANMRHDDPFAEPAPKGQPPYWLRPRDESAEAKHMRLIKQRELAHAARD